MKKAVMRDYYKCMCCFIALFIMSYPLYSQFSKNNLLFWVRSDTLLTTTGSSLNIWNDISGNNFNFIAISSPIVNTSNPSGFTSILFDNSSLLSNNVTSITNFEAFIVYKKSGGVNVYERLIDHNYLDGFWIGRNNNSSHNFGGGYKNAVAPLGIFNDFPDTIANIMHVYKKNNIHSVSNGINSTISQTLSNFSPTLSNKITIGCDLLQTGNLKGDIFEIIFFNDSIRNGVKDSIFTYLKNKYASPVNLPADISLTNTLCDTTIKAIGNFNSYHWSTGATTSSITVNQSGKYWVNATNIFGKVSSDTILVSYPKPNLKSDTTICEGNSFIWNTQLPKSDFTFQWQDNSTDSLFTINTPGQYYVSITDGFGCSFTSNTITVSQDDFASTASLGSDISLCAGNQIALITGLQSGLSYTWSSGETTPAITVTNTAEYSVIITNTNNCIAKDTINVTITGQAPNPNFTFNTACINNQIQFTDASSTPSGNSIASYLWDFGDPLSASNTSTLSNPTHSYTNTGIYTVSLTISTDVGCSKSITKTLTVSPTPTVNFNFGIACQNSAVTFTGSISSGTLTTTATTWNFGDPASDANNSSALLNPSHLFSNQANYPVKLIATNSAGCKDSITKIVNVRGEVKADFTYSAPCANSNVLFQDNSITPAPSNVHTRTWNFSNSANTFIGLTTNQTFTNSGVYSASLTVTGTNGCVSSISKLITVQLKPVVNFTVPPLCAKDTVNIINNSSVGSGVFSSFNWQLNTNSFSSANSPTLSIANSGTYSLSLKITNSAQCADSLTKLITVFALPTVDFETNPPIYLFLDSTVTFIPNSTTGSFYQWEINSEVFNSVTPTYTFNTIGTYSVSLFMRDENGCGNSQLKTIRVFDNYLDLAIRDIITSLDNENFLRVKANLLNMGSVPISRFEISKRINSISDSKESWIGQLNPGNQLLYEFVSTNKLSNTADNKIICLQIESINLITDNNTTNNNLCVALKTNGNEVFEPYPNPSFKEDVIIPALLTNDQIVSIELYNTVGEIVITTLNYTGTEGLNFIKIPSSELSRGTYLLKLTINEKVFMKKLMKN